MQLTIFTIDANQKPAMITNALRVACNGWPAQLLDQEVFQKAFNGYYYDENFNEEMQKEKKRVFEAFYRVGSEATRSSRGTGLGLHLVRLQAQALGGAAEVVDRAGGGCVFRVRLRVASRRGPWTHSLLIDR